MSEQPLRKVSPPHQAAEWNCDRRTPSETSANHKCESKKCGLNNRAVLQIVDATALVGPYIAAMTKLIVWHDGGCPLCRREIALMRRLDRRSAIHFVDVTSAPASVCPIDPAEMLARFHVSEEEGRLLSGAAAFAAMWRAIPLLRPLGLAARSPWLLALLERLYLRFLHYRPWLQRKFAERPVA